MHFSDRLAQKIAEKDSCLLLGLDPDITKIPRYLSDTPLTAIDLFCSSLLEATNRYICGIKIQLAWFECYGAAGISLVEKYCIRARALGLMVLIDGKRSDIGASAAAYAHAYLGTDSVFACDGLTVNPWLGSESLEPFIELGKKNNKAVFVLVKTSNPTADQFQRDTAPAVAHLINDWNTDNGSNNGFGHIGAVIGATRKADELMSWREHMAHTWLLTPGIGAQGGDLDAILNVRDDNGHGLLIPISRAVLYAGQGADYLDKAEQAMAYYWRRQSRC